MQSCTLAVLCTHLDALAFRGRSLVLRKAQRILASLVLKPTCSPARWQSFTCIADALAFRGRSLVLRKARRILAFLVLKPYMQSCGAATPTRSSHLKVGKGCFGRTVLKALFFKGSETL